MQVHACNAGSQNGNWLEKVGVFMRKYYIAIGDYILYCGVTAKYDMLVKKEHLASV